MLKALNNQALQNPICHVPIKRAQTPRLKQSALKQMISYDRAQGENGGCVDSLVPPLFTSSSRIHCCLACAGTWGAYACLHRAASHGAQTFAEMVETPPSLHPPNQPPTHPSIRPSVHPSAQDPCKEQAGEAGKLTCFFLLRGLRLRKAWVAAEVPKAIEAASARF